MLDFGEYLLQKSGASQLISAVAAGLALDATKEAYIWVYRLIIAILLSILSTLFLADRFLPYPWNADKSGVLMSIETVAERSIDNKRAIQELKMQNRAMEMALQQIIGENKAFRHDKGGR